jgi:hypothetical protein
MDESIDHILQITLVSVATNEYVAYRVFSTAYSRHVSCHTVR